MLGPEATNICAVIGSAPPIFNACAKSFTVDEVAGCMAITCRSAGIEGEVDHGAIEQRRRERLFIPQTFGSRAEGPIIIAVQLSVGWPLILIGRLASWFGKGLRGPLRDAIKRQDLFLPHGFALLCCEAADFPLGSKVAVETELSRPRGRSSARKRLWRPCWNRGTLILAASQ